MDSGNNSASLQSSSTGGGVGGGGDEEYDSRAASDSFSSAFHTQNSSMFDPFANYFNPISRPQPPPPLPPPSQNYTTTPNSLFNLDTNWPIKRMRSDQTNNPMLLPSSDNSLSFGTTAGISFPSLSEEHRGGSGNVSVTTTTTEPQPAAAADQPITQLARNPKKRSRASRRAPTTVLTTDTSNFRAMVQEFTGIPAPPFTTTSYFPHRTRFDLFASSPNLSIRSAGSATGAGAAGGAANNNNNNNNPFNISQPPNYLRRPFPQKIQPPPPPFISPPPPSSSSLMLSCLPNINIASVSGSSSTTSNASNSTINYQLPSGVVSSVAQNSNLLDAIQQNSILTSFLQSSQKYPIGSKEHEQFQMPSNEDYSMNSSAAQHGHLLSGLPNLISQEQAAASSRNNNSINAANFHGDKVQETVTTRGGEGMVESWICSSD